MRWPISWAFFALFAVALTPSQRVEACSCQYSHPQTQFCRADFVVLARVIKHKKVDMYESSYKVKIQKRFKLSHAAEKAFEDSRLYTAADDGICGVRLDPGVMYVVSGQIIEGKPSINLCGLSMRWSEVSPRQRKGFRMLYQHNCVCNIQYTMWYHKGSVFNRKQCLWESSPGPQDCQERHGLCMKGPDGCNWFPSVAYKNCIKEYQRKREQQRMREP